MKISSVIIVSVLFQCLLWLPFSLPSCLLVVEAFVISPLPTASRTPFQHRKFDGKESNALIYDENGEMLRQEEPSFVGIDSSLRDSIAKLLDINQLTRVACAFAPPPHSNLHPKQIQSTILVHVDSKELQIALAIPQEKMIMDSDVGVCVQVLVPIPLSCEDENIQDCILQTIHHLDVQATERILEQEALQDRQDQWIQQQLIRQQLQEENIDSLPTWWTFAELKITLAEECETLKVLLNEESFAPDIRKLCQVYSYNNASVSQIWEARVASVGPSGIFLKAYATVTTGGDETHYEIIEVPIQFMQPAPSADVLRSCVLDLVESVETVSEQTLVAPAVRTVQSTATTKEMEVTVTSDEEMTMIREPKQPVSVDEARKQPKSPEEESRLATKYAAIKDLGERAYCILKDLGMI